MRKAWLLALGIMPITGAFADSNYPSVAHVQNTDDKSNIGVSCDTPNADGMRCRFTQMTVYKPSEADAEKRIAEAINGLLKSQPSEFKDCKIYTDMVAALEAGTPLTSVTNTKEFQDNWMKQPPAAKADTIRIVKALADFCANRDSASAEAFARASEELDSSTCQISNFTYERTFQLNHSTNRWQSTVQNNDDCGTITYSEFAKPDDAKINFFWNYSTKDIITNPNGKTILGKSCSAADQSEHRFTWQTGKFYANCRYVQMTP